MAIRRTQLIVATSALLAIGGGYFLSQVLAVQGQGNLAQAPLNDQVAVPPAFIMAVDDSGSMTFETLFPGNNGQGHWNAGTAATNGFYDGLGRLNAAGTGLYAHVIPNGINIDVNNRLTIPPIDNFGFARSAEENPSYFDPSVVYLPWKRANGTSFPDATITAALSDPRNPVLPALDMTGRRQDIAGTDRFAVTRAGMVLPTGTVHYVTANCGGLGTTAPTRNTWVTLAAPVTLTAACRVAFEYFPATFYVKTTSADPPGYVGGRVLATNACGAGCDMWRYEITAANFGAAYPAMIQNFANWYTYYGNRNRAMVAGMTLALEDVEDMRIGFFTINNRIGTVPMRDVSVPADKTALYANVTGLPASGGTPNLFAVEHLRTQFRRTDVNAPVQLACQKNAGMLFTDGFSNSGTPGAPAVGGLGFPFDPTPADSMAAIATRAYLENIRPALPAGQVPVPTGCSAPIPDPRLDCRIDPHMNFYGVTLGARGNLFDPDVPRDPFDPPALAWPGHINDSPTTVDDIWHATVNTRGEYINATTPADITNAMRRILGAVSAGASPSGSIALTGARIGNNTLSVQPYYEATNEGTDWYSTLTASTVMTDPLTSITTFTTAWEAASRMPAPGSRNIWFGGLLGTAEPFVPLNVASLTRLCDNPEPGMSRCTAPQLIALGAPVDPTDLDDAIDYLRGDQSLEVTRGPGGKLRFRTNKLGDIVNSTPVVVGKSDDFGYAALPGALGASYTTFLAAKTASRRPMVFAGANDGMLHGFDGRPGGAGGIEAFAFIPRSVLGHMGNLLFPYDPADGNSQKFQHRYFVDGPVVVADARFGGAWKTVLVGSTGAGAKGAFGLNVSNVSLTAGAFTAADRLWEINNLDLTLPLAVRRNIGHVLGRPVIVPVKTGSETGPVSWRAIFGNGYNSFNNKAVLFMVDMAPGAPVITMVEAVEAAAPAGDNGLGNIVVVDRFGPDGGGALVAPRRDGFADTVYAGDQKGAIWKFDLRTAAPANQTVPVFTTQVYTTGPEAGTRQPIIGGLTAAPGPGGGVLVYFGTGSFSFTTDPVDTTVQSLYAVLDNGSGTTATITNLVEQTITGSTAGGRGTSSNPQPSGSRGFYLDLPAGERFVGYPRVESGVLFMPTYEASATLSVACNVQGQNWLYGLNALSGAAGLSNIHQGTPTGATPGQGTGALSLTTGGSAPVKDVAVLTSPRIAPLGPLAGAAQIAAALAAQCSMIVQVAGAPPLFLPRACGRQSWRQIQ